MSTKCRISLIIASGLWAGCASVSTQIPELNSVSVQKEQAAQEKAAFEEIDKLRERLDRVVHQVLSANTELCERTAPDIGAKTQSLESYPKEVREAARRELGLGDTPSIIFVRVGSPAAKAGLEVGDIVQDEAGKAFAIPSKKFNKAMEEGQRFVRSRMSVEEDIVFTANESCYYPAHLKMSPTINAYANGRSIIVTAGMMNFIESDDELAYIIGHELAHNTHDHIRKSIQNYVFSFGGTRFTRIFEAEADYVGLYYMVRAGYDPSVVENFWRRLALQSLRPIARSKTHPAYSTRAVQIVATRAEIANKQEKGQALLPEPKAKP